MALKQRSYNITNEKLARKRYMSYTALKQTAQDLGIKNRWAYEKWVRRDRPPGAPLYPNRVYKEWVRWGDFLGTGNEFVPFMKWKEMQKKDWVPYWDAARWAQSKGFKSGREYHEAYKRGEFPDNIPCAPQQVYSKKYKGGWISWPAFLGKTIQSKIQTMQHKLKLFAIAGIKGYPQNYFMLLIAPEGKDQLKLMIETNAFRVYMYDDDNKQELGKIVRATCSHQGGDMYMCSNMNELFFELDTTFDFDQSLTTLISKEITQESTNQSSRGSDFY